jgi:hypothetical protein
MNEPIITAAEARAKAEAAISAMNRHADDRFRAARRAYLDLVLKEIEANIAAGYFGPDVDALFEKAGLLMNEI